MSTPNRTATTPSAIVCLYGTPKTGHGLIVELPDGRMVDLSRPDATRTVTTAIREAARLARAAGVERGVLRVFEPGGRRYADTSIVRPAYVGDLQWKAA